MVGGSGIKVFDILIRGKMVDGFDEFELGHCRTGSGHHGTETIQDIDATSHSALDDDLDYADDGLERAFSTDQR